MKLKEKATQDILTKTPILLYHSSPINKHSDMIPFNFTVCEVPKQEKKLAELGIPTLPFRDAVIARTVTERNRYEKKPGDPPRKIEALAASKGLMVQASFHPFMQAMHTAYEQHYGMTISPDMIWLLITQGFALHVNQNAETLRDQFVGFDGKKRLLLQRDRFTKGSELNDWPGVFAEFSQKIEANTGPELLDLVTGKFSTTSPVETAAFQVTLMDAMKSYFEYSVVTLCGIPDITLEGTPADWRLIEEKTKKLAAYDLAWWTDDLLPILAQFTAAAEGNPDQDFWQSIYKWNNIGSGTPYITGWVLNFFPYVELPNSYQKLEPQKIQDWQENVLEVRSTTADKLPSGLSQADLLWDYNGNMFAMELVTGFIGFRQDCETLSLRPEISWAVVDKQTEPSAEAIQAYHKGGNEAYLNSQLQRK